MKRIFLLFALIVFISTLKISAQNLNDYIEQVKGDTLVVKDYYDMNNEPNSLFYALYLDTIDVPESRVYELKVNGYYPYYHHPRSAPNRHTVITGPVLGSLVKNENANLHPPLICHQVAEITTAPEGIEAKNDLTIKNCELVPANLAGGIGWEISHTSNFNLNLVYENCLFEHTFWVFLYIKNENCNVTFRDCYFVNMDGYSGRNNGGVLYSLKNLDTLIVENCTHVMAQGNMYNFGGNLFKRAIINHNTFINCAGYIVSNFDFYNKFNIISNVSLTNNLFINCNNNPVDTDTANGVTEPMGIVNFGIDTSNIKQRKFLCQNNLVYWDPLLNDCDSILNANQINSSVNWEPQMIIMNSGTRGMFGDDNNYPYLVTDEWKNKMPNFTDPEDLFTTQLTNLKTFVIESADESKSTYLLPWRLLNPIPEDFVYPDWPIPIDLSYSDDDLLKGGISGFPIGDLNWLPDKKTEWLAQRTEEYNKIQSALDTGTLITSVQESVMQPVNFQLQQNYPNPFNPSTVISYQLSVISHVELLIYDVLGREIASLVNEKQNAGDHSIYFNGSSLTSGIYIYSLKVNGYEVSKKMVLVK